MIQQISHPTCDRAKDHVDTSYLHIDHNSDLKNPSVISIIGPEERNKTLECSRTPGSFSGCS